MISQIRGDLLFSRSQCVETVRLKRTAAKIRIYGKKGYERKHKIHVIEKKMVSFFFVLGVLLIVNVKKKKD